MKKPVTLKQYIRDRVFPLNFPILVLYDDNNTVGRILEDFKWGYEKESDIRANPKRKEELRTKYRGFGTVIIGTGIDRYLSENLGKTAEVWRIAHELAREGAVIFGLMKEDLIRDRMKALALRFLLEKESYLHGLKFKSVTNGESLFLYESKKPSRSPVPPMKVTPVLSTIPSEFPYSTIPSEFPYSTIPASARRKKEGY